MRKLLFIAAALTVAFGGLITSPATANHERGHWGPKHRVVYMENRIGPHWDGTITQVDWEWGAQSVYGPVYQVVDLWALPYAQRSGNGCAAAADRIVWCYDPGVHAGVTSGGAYAYAGAPAPNAQGHAQWCVTGYSQNALYDIAALRHETGHCLGLAHGGTGVMNGTGVIDGHDLDAVHYAHNVGPHQHP